MSTETQRDMMLAVLDDLERSVRVSDVPRAAFIGFVWAQRREHLLAGEESWADQRIPDVVFGGTTPIIERPRPSLIVENEPSAPQDERNTK